MPYGGNRQRTTDRDILGHVNWFIDRWRALIMLGGAVLAVMGIKVLWPNERFEKVEQRLVSVEEGARVSKANQEEMKTLVRFLVAKQCLESSEQTRRDLAVAGIGCSVNTTPGQSGYGLTVTAPAGSTNVKVQP